jgi:hypothetical protein
MMNLTPALFDDDDITPLLQLAHTNEVAFQIWDIKHTSNCLNSVVFHMEFDITFPHDRHAGVVPKLHNFSKCFIQIIKRLVSTHVIAATRI